MNIVFGSLELGLIFAILALGLFITFRILNLPDLTVDGSFVTGSAVSAILTLVAHPFLGLFAGFLVGLFAGLCTGLLHTKLKIHEILAGILTMTGLYSINLMIMQDKPSLFFYQEKTYFNLLENVLVNNYDISKFLLLCLLVGLVMLVLFYFLKTQLGLQLTATGDNEIMVRSSSINTDMMKILGFMLTNGLVGLAGALYTQYTKTASITSGTGMLVLGLASIIIGESILPKRKGGLTIVAVVLGSILYRGLLTFAFTLGLSTRDLKLFSAVIVVIALAIPQIQKKVKRHA